jgi:hypothetical protein
VDAFVAGVDFAAFGDLLADVGFGLCVSVVVIFDRLAGVGVVRVLLLLLDLLTGVAVERCFGSR